MSRVYSLYGQEKTKPKPKRPHPAWFAVPAVAIVAIIWSVCCWNQGVDDIETFRYVANDPDNKGILFGSIFAVAAAATGLWWASNSIGPWFDYVQKKFGDWIIWVLFVVLMGFILWMAVLDFMNSHH